MYVEPPLTQITLPLERNDDPEITCLACVAKRTCEYVISVKYPGLRRWYGLHAECVGHIEARRG